MAALLKIVDQHFGVGASERLPTVELRLASERITARDIIEQRVEAEVAEISLLRRAHFGGHERTRSFLIAVEPASPEAMLNLSIVSKRKPRKFDVNHEIDRAVAAFEKRQFIMLFDDRQIDELDQMVTVTSESEAVFLYLMPLKGG